MASNIQASARQHFRQAIRGRLFPFLAARGFSRIETPDQHTSSDWHRPRPDGGYDVFSLVFPKRGGASFSVSLQAVPAAGVTNIFDEHIPANKATALSLNRRIHLFPSRANVIARALRAVLHYSPYKIDISGDPAQIPAKINEVIGDFEADFEQAEEWWKSGYLGSSMEAYESTARPKTNNP
jgi:hypothetical protein